MTDTGRIHVSLGLRSIAEQIRVLRAQLRPEDSKPEPFPEAGYVAIKLAEIEEQMRELWARVRTQDEKQPIDLYGALRGKMGDLRFEEIKEAEYRVKDD